MLFKVPAHVVVCIIHGSIKIVHGSIYIIIHDSTPKILIYHEFGSRFLACFNHLVTISHWCTTNAHGSINRAHVSTINTDININIDLI